MKLPITMHPIVTSECWTHYKFAIMQGQKHFDEWLISHFRLYIDGRGYSMYGDMGDMYQLSYFSEFLDIEDCRMQDVSPEKIVDFLIARLSNKYYMIVDVNWSPIYDMLYNTSDTPRGVHEILVYGYDKRKKVFYSFMQFQGKYIEVELPFDFFTKIYKDAYDYYSEYEYLYFERKRWFHSLSAIKPNNKYKPTNLCYDLYDRLNNEWRGWVHVINEYDYEIDDKFHYSFPHYMGVATMKGLSVVINRALEDERFYNKNIDVILKSCLKISEYHQLLYRALNCVVTRLDKKRDDLIPRVKEFEKWCEDAQKLFLLSLKYRYTGDREILKNISVRLESQFKIERTGIKELCESLKESFLLNNVLF